jgi:hypothetical protein
MYIGEKQPIKISFCDNYYFFKDMYKGFISFGKFFINDFVRK